MLGAKRYSTHLLWVDQIKAIALIGIILNHTIERIYGYPLIANPTGDWPPLAARLGQLRPLAVPGVWGLVTNLMRYSGWFGEHGVELFLIVSGFGLTWGLLSRQTNGPLRLGEFYWQRARRVYPLWWGVHLLFAIATLALGSRDQGLWPGDLAFYLSFLGLRITPELFYHFAPAWWYVGLLLQLYLVYPLLWAGLRRRGPGWLLVIGCTIGFIARAVGLIVFDGYMDAWQRGATFLTRLPEFVFGISFAFWFYRNPEGVHRRLVQPALLLAALGALVLGSLLSLTLMGMTFAYLLIGVGAFVLLYALLAGAKSTARSRIGLWIGQHSYSLYLIHHPIILLLVPAGLTASSQRMAAGLLAVPLLTWAGAMTLEWTTSTVLRILGRWRQSVGLTTAGVRVFLLGAATMSLLIAGDRVIQGVSPQEVAGWGERPSLAPHPVLGYYLQPSQKTHLRWESYDYWVTSNPLGFPGPEYPVQKAPGTLRILVTGDAFTSAEGVDTALAWPRLLESNLADRYPNREIEVLNFAVTGYGPNQYAAIIDTYAPRYRPDLIVIGFFANEYQDVLQSNEAFQQSIGFGLPSADSWYYTLRLAHVRHLIRDRLAEPLKPYLGKQDNYGYLLGNLTALEQNRPEFAVMGRDLVAGRLREIKEVAGSISASVILVMIPTSVQVCDPDQLPYYPRGIDLHGGAFDLDLPQRLTEGLAGTLGIGYYDLRPALQEADACPYQPHNMHWTANGHRIVADYLARQLVTDGYVGEP